MSFSPLPYQSLLPHPLEVGNHYLTRLAIPIQHASSGRAVFTAIALDCLPKLTELILVGCEEIIDDDDDVSSWFTLMRYNQVAYLSDPEEIDASQSKEKVEILDKEFKDYARQRLHKKHPRPK